MYTKSRRKYFLITLMSLTTEFTGDPSPSNPTKKIPSAALLNIFGVQNSGELDLKCWGMPMARGFYTDNRIPIIGIQYSDRQINTNLQIADKSYDESVLFEITV